MEENERMEQRRVSFPVGRENHEEKKLYVPLTFSLPYSSPPVALYLKLCLKRDCALEKVLLPQADIYKILDYHNNTKLIKIVMIG